MTMQLPEPHFVDRDPAVVLAECIAKFEELAERPLSPDQAERLMLDVIAYRETLLRIRIQEAAKQNLLRYARYPMIDLLAQLLGVERNPPAPALTTLRFSRRLEWPTTNIIPAGTRVRSKDGKVTFATIREVLFGFGELDVDVPAAAVAPGVEGNGYALGQIANVVDGAYVTAVNIEVTRGGAPSESTEAFRARIPGAIRAYSTAGSRASYRYHALRAHPEVLDVYAHSPADGVVRVAVLAQDGEPQPSLLALVQDYLSDEYRRPMTDTVEVVGATPVSYSIDGLWWPEPGLDVAGRVAAEVALMKARDAHVLRLRSGFGRSAVLSQMYAALSVPGVSKIQILSGDGPVVGPSEFGNLSSSILVMQE